MELLNRVTMMSAIDVLWRLWMILYHPWADRKGAKREGLYARPIINTYGLIDLEPTVYLARYGDGRQDS